MKPRANRNLSFVVGADLWNVLSPNSFIRRSDIFSGASVVPRMLHSAISAFTRVFDALCLAAWCAADPGSTVQQVLR